MAEAFNELDLPEERAERYQVVFEQAQSVLMGERDFTARLATLCSMVKHAFPYAFWAGFYLVDRERPDELVVGPYQGTLGCLRIRFGRGVCGAAAVQKKAQLVPDVHAFPGHIACDSRSASEVVVPFFDAQGALLGVFDVDATEKAAFDERDVAGLTRLLRLASGDVDG